MPEIKLDKNDVLSWLEKIHFFKEFSAEEKQALASMESYLVSYKPGAKLIVEGEIDVSLFILLKGTVRVTTSKIPTVPIADLKAGAVFGEISFVSKRLRSTNVTSVNDVTVLKMDGVLFDRIPDAIRYKIKDRLMELIIDRLDEMNNALIQTVRYRDKVRE